MSAGGFQENHQFSCWNFEKGHLDLSTKKMRFLYGAIVIFIIFFKESETAFTWGNRKLKTGSTSLVPKGEQSRLNIGGTPKRTNPADFPKLRRTLPIDLVTQHELENHEARPSASPAMDLLSQYKAQHPEFRPKSPRKSSNKKHLPVDSNPLYPAELGPAPPNQLLMNGEILSESQMYKMGLQRYGGYPPLIPKPPTFHSNSEASGSGYQN